MGRAWPIELACDSSLAFLVCGDAILRSVPYQEQKDSLMCDISKRIPSPDLKQIILKLESDLKGMK
jgi:hypothetical protein